MKKRVCIAVAAVVILLAGFAAWSHFYRVAPQPAWIDAGAQDKFFYASTDADQAAGLPYWIWLALPRMFPEYMPGPGGYASLGLSWEEGREMPVGFAKQRIGYVRVTGNCALCHTISYPAGADEAPKIVAAVRGRATDIQPLLTFLKRCAQDPRFNADEIFSEVDTATKLGPLERLQYRFMLIPRTRDALINDPSSVLFAPALRAHIHDPGSDAPFAAPRMRAWKEEMQGLEEAQ